MTISLSACGTIKGLPSHGGSRRATANPNKYSKYARKAVKSMNLEALEGKKVGRVARRLFLVGSNLIQYLRAGNFTGGRYSITNLIRGEYQNLPNSITEYSYPEYQTIAETNTDGLNGTTVSNIHYNRYKVGSPVAARDQEGKNFRGGVEISSGNSEYKNETLIQNPQDSVFLSRLIQTVLFLRGIEVAPNEAADAFLFVNIDVFGTIRNRTELHFFNRENLTAETKLEYFAIDKNSRILIKPEVNSFAARYKENYILWTGPLSKSKNIEEADKLLVDFSDITPYSNQNKFSSQIEEFSSSDSENSIELEIIKDRRK